MIVDVTLNQLKAISRGGSNLLRWESVSEIRLYYINQSSVIFRTILSRPLEENEYTLLINSLPSNIPVMNVIEPAMLPAESLSVLQDINVKLELILTKLNDTSTNDQ